MKVYSLLEIDMETGLVLREESCEYHGPVALCDRSAQNQAAQTFNTAASTQANAANQAQSVAGSLIPSLQSMANNPQGYGAAAVNTMQNEAQQAAGATADKANQNLSLQAMRSGNVAGLGAGEEGSVEGASRAQQTGIQQILAQNAQLKAQQQEGALSGLSNVMGQENQAAGQALNTENQATNAGVDAGKSGWLQNLMGSLADIGKLGMGAGAVGLKI